VCNRRTLIQFVCSARDKWIADRRLLRTMGRNRPVATEDASGPFDNKADRPSIGMNPEVPNCPLCKCAENWCIMQIVRFKD